MLGDAAVEVISRWATAIFARSDLRAAWPLTHLQMRLHHAQKWLTMEADRPDLVGHDRDHLAHALAAEHPTNGAWFEFSWWRTARWQSDYPDLGGPVRAWREATYGPLAIVTLCGQSPAGVDEPHTHWYFAVTDTEHAQVVGTGPTIAMAGWPPKTVDLLPDHEQIPGSDWCREFAD